MSKELAEMFVESTGSVLVDSGSFYGRQYQTHRAACGDRTALEYCESRPEASFWGMSATHKELYVSVDLYHYLKSRVTFCRVLTEQFNSWVEQDDRRGRWTSDVATWIAETTPEDIEWYEGYTYSHENCLSQDFQYLLWENDDTKYIAIQIHGGCDARWGFTDVKIFEMDRYGDNHPVYDCQTCGIYANPINDDTADGFSWYSSGSYFEGGNGNEPDLWDLPWFDGTDFADGDDTRNEDGTLVECVIILNNRAFYSNGEGVLYELLPGAY